MFYKTKKETEQNNNENKMTKRNGHKNLAAAKDFLNNASKDIPKTLALIHNSKETNFTQLICKENH